MFDIHISSLEKKFLSSKKRIIHLYREPIVFFFVIYQISRQGLENFEYPDRVWSFPLPKTCSESIEKSPGPPVAAHTVKSFSQSSAVIPGISTPASV